jgi:cytochrome c biogenesis protein CcmG/thiol:disulfide interchange protein DsbE
MPSRLLPFFGFVLVFALLGFGIYWSQHHDPREVPSPLIGKPAPKFSLPLLEDPSKKIGSAELAGEPYLLNVFASWCFACREEHPILMNEGKRLGVKLVGFDYKDDPDDAKRWIRQYGDPYDVIVADVPGNVAIDFGVTGAPETFLVDAKGVIRYKYISPITPEVIATELLPRIALLEKESAR